MGGLEHALTGPMPRGRVHRGGERSAGVARSFISFRGRCDLDLPGRNDHAISSRPRGWLSTSAEA